LMLVVGALRRDRFFDAAANVVAAVGGTSRRRVLWALLAVAAGVSALVPNIAVVLLLGSLALTVARRFAIPPGRTLVQLVMASNVGGLATLIGDPPNILIGTAAHVGFLPFLEYMAPLVAALLVVLMVSATWGASDAPTAFADFRPEPPRVGWSVVAAAATVVAVGTAESLTWPVGPVAAAGGVAAAAAARLSLREALAAIDWDTLGLIAGLLVVTAALAQQGVPTLVAEGLRTGPAGPWRAVMVMGGVALISALVDNLPIVAGLIPVVKEVATATPVLWYAVAIGAALGGNATPVGAASNLTALALARTAGYPVSFGQYLRWAIPATGAMFGLAAVYVAVWPAGGH
jgi:Na+/H+ antiporter NhaD/arsenite permease-like protein